MKNIIFDFGCVLVDLDKRRCVDAFNAIGAGNISVYVDECRQEDLFHDLETGVTDVPAFCEEVRRKSPGCTATDAQICGAWNMLLAGIPRRRLQRLTVLRQRYRLFVLSNTNAIHWEKAVRDFFTYDGQNVGDYFEKVFLSYKMHMVKPSPEIFAQTIREAGIDASETLFIDDSAVNCLAARNAGLMTMHVSGGDEWAGIT